MVCSAAFTLLIVGTIASINIAINAMIEVRRSCAELLMACGVYCIAKHDERTYRINSTCSSNRHRTALTLKAHWLCRPDTILSGDAQKPKSIGCMARPIVLRSEPDNPNVIFFLVIPAKCFNASGGRCLVKPYRSK
jgi:hypothetical protein